MFLHAITAAMLLNWGVMLSPVQTNDLSVTVAPVNAFEMAMVESFPQECLDQLWEEAAVEWNTTVEILEDEYNAGDIEVDEIRPDIYQATRSGGSIYISVCSGGN